VFLDDAIERDFAGIPHDKHEQTEKGSWPYGDRTTWCTSQIQWLKDRHDWPGLQSVCGEWNSYRTTAEETTCERRYLYQ